MIDELIKNAINGDKESFNHLIYIYQDDLYRIAKYRLNSEDDVCDAVKDTFCQAYKSIRSLKQAKYFKTWLIKILINKCNDIYRRTKLNIISFESAEVEKYTFIDEENKNGFYDFLDELDTDEKTMMILFYVDGYKAKEISKIMDINYATVRSKIRRAKIKLSEKLKREEEEYDGQYGQKNTRTY